MSTKGGRPKSADKMRERLTTNVTGKQKIAYEEACRSIRNEPATILRELALAFTAHVQAHKSVTLPISISAPKPD